MSGKRSRRLLASVRRSRVRTFAGVAAGRSDQSGSARMTAARMSAASAPGNARFPVSISNSTHPNAQMSARLSTVRPRACSGAMYGAVPRTTSSPDRSSAAVIVGESLAGDEGRVTPVSNALPRPKSRIFTLPSGRTLMLAGLRSRCTMPCSCAASSPVAISIAMAIASSIAIGPLPIRSASSIPGTSSITMARTSPDSSMP